MHTRRDWRFRGDPDSAKAPGGLEVRWINQDAPRIDGMQIKFASSVTAEDADARAKLIAAAPEMEATLRNLRKRFNESAGGGQTLRSRDAIRKTIDEVLRRLR